MIPHAAIFATQKILPDEEITIDYGSSNSTQCNIDKVFTIFSAKFRINRTPP